MVRTVDSGRKQRAGLQHKNAAEEKVSEEEKCWRVLAPHLWPCPPAEAPGEAELPVLPAWETGPVLYILTLATGANQKWGGSKKKKEGKKFWEIPPDQNTAFKTAVLFFTHIKFS